MAREFSRTQRVADFLQRELASLIQQELRDPRIGMVSVTGVEVSRDMSYAKVFVTVVGKDSAEEAAECIAVLNNAAGFLRSQISRMSNARTTPKLNFRYDVSVRRGQQLSGLIDRAVESDRKLAQNAADAQDGEVEEGGRD